MNESRAPGIQRLEEVAVFENRYLRLFDDRVKFASGAEGTYLRAVWKAPYGVAVLPSTAAGDYLLVRQFHYARGAWILQVPKGMGEVDVAPEEMAARELLEETGYRASRMELVRTLYVDPGLISNPVFVFRAHGAVRAGGTKRERSEVIEGPIVVPPHQLRDPGWLAEISDTLTLAILLQETAFELAG